MPKKAARMLAFDSTVASEELEAAISYLEQKLADASFRNEPVPFLAYRNRMIFRTTLDIRRQKTRRGEF